MIKIFLETLWRWKYGIIFSLTLATIYIEKNGFLLSYLKLAGWIFIGVALALTILVSGAIDSAFRKKIHISRNFRIWIGFPFFFLFFSLNELGSGYILKNYSGYPLYVLYPCSYPPSPGVEDMEAKRFWRLKPFQDFDCGSDSG